MTWNWDNHIPYINPLHRDKETQHAMRGSRKFLQRVSTFDEGIGGAIIGIPAKRHLNVGYDPTLNTDLVAYVIFRDLDQ